MENMESVDLMAKAHTELAALVMEYKYGCVKKLLNDNLGLDVDNDDIVEQMNEVKALIFNTNNGMEVNGDVTVVSEVVGLEVDKKVVGAYKIETIFKDVGVEVMVYGLSDTKNYEMCEESKNSLE